MFFLLTLFFIYFSLKHVKPVKSFWLSNIGTSNFAHFPNLRLSLPSSASPLLAHTMTSHRHGETCWQRDLPRRQDQRCRLLWTSTTNVPPYLPLIVILPSPFFVSVFIRWKIKGEHNFCFLILNQRWTLGLIFFWIGYGLVSITYLLRVNVDHIHYVFTRSVNGFILFKRVLLILKHIYLL